jgi:hypothetical protein
VLPQKAIEAALDRVLMVGGERRLNQLRDQAREVAEDMGYNAQFKRLGPLPLIAALGRIQRWSAAFDYARPRSDVRE